MSQIPVEIPVPKSKGSYSNNRHGALWRKEGRYCYVVCTLNVEGYGPPTAVFAQLINAGVQYIHAGREEGSHKHWQCYFEAPSNWETKRWNKLLEHGSFQQAKGTASQCIDYQSKEDEDPYVFGKWRNHGRGGTGASNPRNDLKAFVAAVRTGQSDAALFSGAQATAMVKYPGAALRIRSAFAPKRTKMPCTRFMWGLTGTGKTYQAVVIDKAEKVKMRFPFLIGYSGMNRCIVFDEFRWADTPIEDLLEMLDEHTTTVEIKGGTVPFNAELIYFCSNTDPATWYPKADPEHREALMRRIREGGGGITHCTKKYVKGTIAPSLFQAWKKTSTTASRTRSPSPLRARSPTPTSSTGSQDSDETLLRRMRRGAASADLTQLPSCFNCLLGIDQCECEGGMVL